MYIGTLQAVSNEADWSQSVSVIDAESGEAASIARAALWVCSQDSPESAVLAGSTDNGKLSLTGDGFDIGFSPVDMSALCPGMHDVFVRVELATGQVVQLIAGQLPVVEGGPAW